MKIALTKKGSNCCPDAQIYEVQHNLEKKDYF
jgi:hypothetical protein